MVGFGHPEGVLEKVQKMNPRAPVGFFRRRLRLAAGVFIQLATLAIWGCLVAEVVLGASFFVSPPQAFTFYACHTATKLVAAVGAFWLLEGLFSAGGGGRAGRAQGADPRMFREVDPLDASREGEPPVDAAAWPLLQILFRIPSLKRWVKKGTLSTKV